MKPSKMYCPQCGTPYETQASHISQVSCPDCGDTSIQNLAHDMVHGGNWSGMTDVTDVSDISAQDLEDQED